MTGAPGGPSGARGWLPLALAYALAALVAIQAAYLAYGGAFVRYWDVTEYREFFIPLALLVLAVRVLRRASRDAGAGAARGRTVAGR